MDVGTIRRASEMAKDQPWNELPPEGRMLRPREVARLTGLSKSKIYAMIAVGEFPAFVKLAQRASALPETWLRAFIEHRAAMTVGVHRERSSREGCRHDRP